MITWYLKCRNLIKALHEKSTNALHYFENNEEQVAKTTAGYIKADFQYLLDHWHSRYPDEVFGSLGRHIKFGEKTDFSDIIKYDLPDIEAKLDQYLAEFEMSLPNNKSAPYVAEERIIEIDRIETSKFDTTKLIQLLRELNSAYNNDSHFAVGILVRAIIDHVPPIFNCPSFNEVANNYRGTKSFKDSMKHLNVTLRSLADSYLHTEIRRTESLPTMNQVDFRANLDALLSEVSRLLQGV